MSIYTYSFHILLTDFSAHFTEAEVVEEIFHLMTLPTYRCMFLFMMRGVRGKRNTFMSRWIEKCAFVALGKSNHKLGLPVSNV